MATPARTTRTASTTTPTRRRRCTVRLRAFLRISARSKTGGGAGGALSGTAGECSGGSPADFVMRDPHLDHARVPAALTPGPGAASVGRSDAPSDQVARPVGSKRWSGNDVDRRPGTDVGSGDGER